MRRGLLFFQPKGEIAWGIFLFFLFGAGLSGCGGTSQASSPKPIACTLQAPPTVNIYRATPTPIVTPQTGVGGAFTNLTQEQVLALLQSPQGQQSLPTLPVVPANNNFGKLIHEVKSWSDIVTLKIDTTNYAQVIVTFLSPELIRAVYNNEMSIYGVPNPNAQPVLDKIAERNELIFFVSVITTTNNNIGATARKILIPIQKMALMNVDDVSVPPLHDDHNLAQPIDSTLEPVFGYLTYPMAMMQGGTCSWILNPDYNKKIIIIVPDIYVDDISFGPFTWIIPYSPLFDPEFPPPSPTAVVYDASQTSSSLTPPSPVTSVLMPNGMGEDAFWLTYARFIWKQVVMGNY